MSYTPLVTDGSGPSPVSTGTQSFTGPKTFSGGVQGPGTVPLGAIMPVVNSSPITGGGYTIPPSGTVDANGWQLCNGVAIPSGNTLTGSTPDLSDGRYLRGSTVSGTIGGSNAITIGSANLPTHTHGSGTLANAAEAAHTHTKSGGVSAEGAHYHASTALSGNLVNAAELAHTHTSALPAHRHFMKVRGTSSDGAHGHGMVEGAHVLAQEISGDDPHLVGLGNYARWGGSWSAAGNHGHTWGGSWNNDSSSIITAPEGDGSGNTYQDGVGYWGVNGTRATSAGSSHNHVISGHTGAVCAADGTTAATHTHADTIAYGVGSSHNHVISGSTDNGGFANTSINNEPQYLNVRYLIRVK
jgi:hypothetical protein